MCKISFNTFTFHNFLALNVILYMYIYIYICILCIIYYIYKYIHKCILYIYIYILVVIADPRHTDCSSETLPKQDGHTAPPPDFLEGFDPPTNLWWVAFFMGGCRAFT